MISLECLLRGHDCAPRLYLEKYKMLGDIYVFPCKLTLAPLWEMLNVVSQSVDPVTQVKVVVVVVRETKVYTVRYLRLVCSTEKQASPHIIVTELPFVL